MARQKNKLKPVRLRTAPPVKGFRVAARTLLHLGRELITSDEIALNELIKNSFDAGSKTVNVRIVCPVPMTLIQSLSASFGQSALPTPAILENALTKLASAADERKLASETTEHLESIFQQLRKAKNSNDIKRLLEEVNFIEVLDTGCGIAPKSILPVFLTVGTDFKVVSKPPENVDEFLGNKGIGRLAMMRLGERARVETWVAADSRATIVDFDWRAFDSGAVQISDVPVKQTRRAKAADHPSGTIIRICALRGDWIEGGAHISDLTDYIRRLRSPFGARRAFRIRITLNDGKAMPFPPMAEKVRKLADQHLTLTFHPENAKAATDEVLKVTIKVSSEDESVDEQMRSVAVLSRSLGGVSLAEMKALGPFTLTILRCNRRAMRQKAKQEWNNEVLPELNVWSGGIAIYRDGFRVGFTGSERDGDWLGLDHKALRGSGYIVNRIQVVGALEIGHAANPGLVDQTNREGLIATPEQDLLRKILLQFAINPLRGIVEAADEIAKRQDLENFLNEGSATLNERLVLAKNEVSSLRSSVPKALRNSVGALDEHLHFISTQVSKFEKAVEKAGEGREDILELAGVGTVMRGVMHELARTTAQTRELMSNLAESADEQTQGLLRKLEDEIKAINTRLHQLDPLMPDKRQSKRDVDVGKQIRTILSGYVQRFDRDEIDAVVVGADEKAPVKVKMVPGFLSLALENLISNSVYWLAQRDDKAQRGRIEIEVDGKAGTISVTDNGPGVALSDRERIFLPGISLRDKGKGYGLYLAREVAEYHGGKLYLDPHSKLSGTLHTFVLELPETHG